MPSVVDDFGSIARRVGEIRSARWHELGVSPPVVSNTPQSIAPPESTEDSRFAPTGGSWDLDRGNHPLRRLGLLSAPRRLAARRRRWLKRIEKIPSMPHLPAPPESPFSKSVAALAFSMADHKVLCAFRNRLRRKAIWAVVTPLHHELAEALEVYRPYEAPEKAEPTWTIWRSAAGVWVLDKDCGPLENRPL